MLAALQEYANGSDIDVFLIARDLEYGIKEASVDQNILHTLMLFQLRTGMASKRRFKPQKAKLVLRSQKFAKAPRTRGRHPRVPRQCI